MTSESEATQNLIKLINQIPDTPQLAWVISGLNEWIRQQPAERCPIDFYLGLSALEAGKYSAATRLQMEMRNFYIREAIREIQQKRGIKRWPAINHILTEISRIKPFVGKRPPKDRVEYNLFQAIALNMDNHERSAITEKLIDIELKLNKYQTERDALESEQRKAANLLVTGEMTDDQFDANRRKLSELYEAIDSITERDDIYRKALDQKSTKLLSELNSQLTAMRRVLVGLEIKERAADIASKSDQSLRELAALISHHHPNQNESFSQLGGALASALFGESNGSPREQDQTERNQLAKQVLDVLEV